MWQWNPWTNSYVFVPLTPPVAFTPWGPRFWP
jgi:hypothetical protein